MHAADLARALPDLEAAGARQAMRRVRRVLGSTLLTSAALTPGLLKVVLRLVGDEAITLVLDSTRCRGWEVFTLGVVFHGRVLPVAWSVLPYPWPKGQFTPTVVALLDRTLRAWPDDPRRIHLVADRGFPSLKLFECLESWRGRRSLDYTIRLRAGDWVHLADGRSVRLADLLKLRAACAGASGAGVIALGWSREAASYRQQKKRSPIAWLVIGRGESEPPAHQRGPADQARREARAKRRLAHILSKAPGPSKSETPQTDRVWLLLTTVATIEQVRATYSLRFHTEGTYRDLKEWDLESVAAQETARGHLDGRLGLAALGYFVQSAVGAMAGSAAGAAEARQRQWCTTDRLSVYWRGRQVLRDRAHDWRPWLKTSLSALRQQLAARRPGGGTVGPTPDPSQPLSTKEAA